MNQCNRGFTLIEMLVALSIFAVIGTAATIMLGRVSDFKVRLDARSEQLAQLQAAHHRMTADIRQMVWRPIRDEVGATGIALIGGTGSRLLELTRRGWQNPLSRQRSDLQRVLYRYSNGELHRLYWQVLDRPPATEPVQQLLLSNMNAIQMEFIDNRGLTFAFWPQAASLFGDGSQRHLLAIKIILDGPHFGKLEWLMPVIFNHQEGYTLRSDFHWLAPEESLVALLMTE